MTEAWVYDAWGLSSTSNDVVLDFADGTLVRRWLHGPWVDEPLAFQTLPSGPTDDLHADRQGSILRVVDPATGTVAAGYDYDSFGSRVATGVLAQRYGFTGREADGESGLIYFRARHYDPATGTFLQRDPIGFAGGDLNLYAYVWNSPQNWSDPSGLAVTADYAINTGQRAGVAAGLGGLFGAVRNLALAISAAIVWNAANSGDDGAGGGPGSGPGDNGGPPLVDPPPPLDPMSALLAALAAIGAMVNGVDGNGIYWAVSTGRRNTSMLLFLQHLVHSLRRCLPAESFARPAVQR